MKSECVCPVCTIVYDGNDNLVSLLSEDHPKRAAIEAYECPSCNTYLLHNKLKYSTYGDKWERV